MSVVAVMRGGIWHREQRESGRGREKRRSRSVRCVLGTLASAELVILSSACGLHNGIYFFPSETWWKITQADFSRTAREETVAAASCSQRTQNTESYT